MVKKFSDLFVFDLDGTLVHRNLDRPGRSIPDDLLLAVQAIATQAYVVVATGRRFRAAEPDIRVLPAMPYCILHNGLLLKDRNGLTVDRTVMADDLALSMANMILAEGAEPFFVVDGYEHGVDFLVTEDAMKRSEIIRSLKQRVGEHCHIISAFSGVAHLPVLEVATLGPYEDLLRIQNALRNKLPQGFRAVVVKNIGMETMGALEVFPLDRSKGSAVRMVRERLQVERVIAIGDDENDLEMIESADIGVVMNHAAPHIRAVGTLEVTGSEGLAQFLKGFYSL